MVVLIMTLTSCSRTIMIESQVCPNPPLFENYHNVHPDLLAKIRRNDSLWYTYSEQLRVRANCENP